MASDVCMDKAMCKSQTARSPGAIKIYTPYMNFTYRHVDDKFYM